MASTHITADAATGSIIFGGYDTKKYSDPITVLDVVPTNGSMIYALAVSWTFLGLSDTNGTTLVSNSSFPLEGILDSSKAFVEVPVQIFQPIADYFGASYNPKADMYGVDCSVADWNGTLDFGFGGGEAVIQVPFAELALPLGSSPHQNPSPGGISTCVFGLQPTNATTGIILGDTFLRSAYVIYDLQAHQIAIAQTVFNSQDSDIKPISSGTNLVSILGSGAQAATVITAVPSHSIAAMTTQLNSPTVTGQSAISGITTSLHLPTTVTETGGAYQSSSSSSSKAAAAAPTDGAGARGAMAGGSLLAMVVAGLL